MDRFESSCETIWKGDVFNLHSNMDRFESGNRYRLCCYRCYIYIPIWIDLKDVQKPKATPPVVYLHSNMDRFESYTPPCRRIQRFHIYIPIWIDLKAVVNDVVTTDDVIYIPIWIDLKDDVYQSKIDNNVIYIPIWIDLKGGRWDWLKVFDLYLHSNMDRFERISRMTQTQQDQHLHSNMDRFERWKDSKDG